jgi:hypothetical protein
MNLVGGKRNRRRYAWAGGGTPENHAEVDVLRWAGGDTRSVKNFQ